ncbi:ubiquinol-cytochrome c reductase core subunit 1 [Sorochytrium milnesiophthora]
MLSVARRQLFTATALRAEAAAARSRVGEDLPAQALPYVTSVEQLAGGLNAATIETQQPMASLVLAVPAGPRYESLENQGAAHFVKNFAFKTTSSQTPIKITRETELRGAQVSTQLTREHLLLKADFLRDDLPYIVELFADVVQNTKYNHWEYKEVSHTVAEEASSAYATPSVIAAEIAHRLAFRTGLGNSLFAPPTSMVDIAAIKAFAAQNVKLGNKAAFAGVGVSQKELVSTLESFLDEDAVATGGAAASSKYFGGEQRIESTNGNSIVVAFKGCDRASSEHAPLAVLRALLGGQSYTKWGAGESPLTKIAQSARADVAAFNVTYADSGLFGITANAQDAATVGTAAQQAVSALKKIASGIDSADLQRAINQAKATAFNHLDTRSEMAASMAVQLSYNGKFMPASDMGADIAKVTADDVKKTAQRLVSSKPTIVVAGALHRLPYADNLGF